MSAILDYKCPNCGGAIKYNSTNGKFQCESCDSIFTQEELNRYAEMLNSVPPESSYDWQPDNRGETLDGMNSYSCNSCGAQIVTDGTTAASTCPYCGSPIVLAGQLSGMNKPDCVLPFKLSKDDAVNKLKEFYKGKFLLPKIFKSENRIKEMQGVYVPFWLFGCTANANIVFDATRTRTWSDSNYNYTETKHYNVYRSGRLGFSNIPADGSSKMDDAYMEGLEPFDYKEMAAFDPAYLSGYLADKYDVDATASFPRAESRIENSTGTAIASTVSGYTSVTPRNTSINTTDGSYKYAMLPVWMLTTRYKDKNYIYAVNGQTGKVSGELPVDRKKFFLMLGGIAAAVIAVGQFFVF